MTVSRFKRPSPHFMLIALVVISVCVLYLTSCDNFSGPAPGIAKKDTTTVITPSGSCDTATVSYSMTIQPLLNTNCVSCHSDSFANAGVNLSSYANVRRVTAGNRIIFAVQGSNGILQMPLGSRLTDCEIAQVRSWVRQGALNN